MRKDRFTDEALRNAYALAELKYSENEEDQVAFEEAYNFTTCERPDGSRYGTSGQCRKGTETSAAAKANRTASQLAPKEQAARAERQKAGEANRQAQAGAAAAAKAATKTAARRGESPEMKAKDNELRTQIKDKMGQQKERKAELDRIERAFKMQEKAVKAEPTKENKERLKRVRTALIQQERSYNRGERELEKMGKERMRLQQKMERAKMSPAQRAEDRRIRAIIRERG